MTDAAPGGATGRARRLWAARAWLPGGWRERVLLEIGGDGCWRTVTAGVARPEAAEVVGGPALPGLVDAHSHAFQRAFAGLAEHDGADFWSWRERMYSVAHRIDAPLLRAVAAHLYVELLRGGYTHVCEFHYLHRGVGGQALRDPLEMARALVDAADDAGIGITVLPALYERAGFGEPALRDEQRRFASSAESVAALRDELQAAARRRGGSPGLVATGVAIHSLRAAHPSSMLQLIERAGSGPIHIHVGEQSAEVEACVAHTGLRPIEWLVRHAPLDSRWHLVHSTHATPAEIESVRAAAAAVVLCPSTEANLGDGLPDLPRWLAAGAALSIGSDSHVTREWREELRWLEYGQRLALRTRCVAARSARGASPAERLWSALVDAPAAAAPAGLPLWGLRAGARADLLVVDAQDDALLGVPDERLLDALVFSSPVRPWSDVMVAGRWVAGAQHRERQARIASAFEAAMRELHRGDARA